MNNLQQKTGFYVPVLRDEPIDPTASDERIHSTIDQMTVVLMLAIAGLFIASFAHFFGWFSTPDERQGKALETTQQQLNQTNAELTKIKSCLGRN